MRYPPFPLLFSFIFFANSVCSLTFVFDESVRQKATRDQVIYDRMLQIDKLGNHIDDALDAMYRALFDTPDDPVAKDCRRAALGPFNEREDIQPKLWSNFKSIITDIGMKKIAIGKLHQKMLVRGGYISTQETTYRENGKRKTTKALFISGEFFALHPANRFENLLYAVIQAADPTINVTHFVIRKLLNPTTMSGEYDVRAYPSRTPIDRKIDEVVPGTWDGGSYDLILNQPSGAKRSFLNPNVYTAFAQCLDRRGWLKPPDSSRSQRGRKD